MGPHSALHSTNASPSATQTRPPVNADDTVLSLHLAVREGKVQGVRQLVEKGVKANSRDQLKRTPLHWAVVLGYDDIGKVLLVNTSRQTLQAGDRWCRTVLHYAAAQGRTDLARIMLDRGAILDAKDEWGCTPLHLAAQNTCLKTLELLLSRGADAHAKDTFGRLPWHYAAKLKAAAMISLLPGVDDTIGNGQGDQRFMDVKRDQLKHGNESEISLGKGSHGNASSLAELLGAWKGAESTARLKKCSTQSPQIVRLHSALAAWRNAEKALRRSNHSDSESHNGCALIVPLGSSLRTHPDERIVVGGVKRMAAEENDNWAHVQSLVAAVGAIALPKLNMGQGCVEVLQTDTNQNGSQEVLHQRLRDGDSLSTCTRNASWCTEWEVPVKNDELRSLMAQIWMDKAMPNLVRMDLSSANTFLGNVALRKQVSTIHWPASGAIAAAGFC